mmetsp:Transcript_66018/g.148975  ORF Transcript_66018/g.148975 Transcript_66018/m.148975 type:complete len:281 (+) Transcript_66018:30-872(+)
MMPFNGFTISPCREAARGGVLMEMPDCSLVSLAAPHPSDVPTSKLMQPSDSDEEPHWEQVAATSLRPEASEEPIPGSEALAEGVAIDPNRRFPGRVKNYHRQRGYGFISLCDPGVVDGDAVFVFWQSIKTRDRYPSLMKGMEVEFCIRVEPGATSTRPSECLAAFDVTLQGGDFINLHSKADEQKVIVGGKDRRFTGTLKFYVPARGYGYITLDDNKCYRLSAEEVNVPKEIRVEAAEMNATGQDPVHLRSVAVEFGIWKTSRGAYTANNVTLLGGKAIP